MQIDSLAWRKKEEALLTDEDGIIFQGDYVKELISLSDYPKFDVDEVNKIFIDDVNNQKENFMTYRDKVFRSVMTGNIGRKFHTKWIDAEDDSKEFFLSDN